MAISEWLPGLKVEIRINGDAVKEYDLGSDEEDEPQTTTKYIEVSSGHEFEVFLEINRAFEHAASELTVYTSIDGTFVNHTLVKSFSGGLRKQRIGGARGFDRTAGVWTYRPFMFSALSTDDSGIETITSERKRRIQSLGLIDIRVCRVKKKSIQAPKNVPGPCMVDLGAVPEKALKGNAISHSTVFGKAIVIPPKNTYDVEYTDTRENPLYTFRFKYRSISALKAMCIVPRSPSPEPLEERARRDPASLTREELLELQQIRNNEDAVRSQIKQESKRARAWSIVSDSQLESSPTNTVEKKSRKRCRRSGNSAVEAIDLCDD